VDELFNDYLRRPGFVEPLAAKFCNGTTAICEGLSQWGSENLAQQGYNSVEILRSYYGDVEIVNNAPVLGYTSSYPGTTLRRGTTGPSVVTVQASLNRIGQSYPAIPKIPTVDGIFGLRTENAVRKFQEVFNLTPDGVVGELTWDRLYNVYLGLIDVTAYEELDGLALPFPGRNLQPGDTGDDVRALQQYLNYIARSYPNIPTITVDGAFGPATAQAVDAFEEQFGLPDARDVVNAAVWNAITRVYDDLYLSHQTSEGQNPGYTVN
jgi:peptidoglycan hydrolase-like protein with peptidoglycan-binding domain